MPPISLTSSSYPPIHSLATTHSMSVSGPRPRPPPAAHTSAPLPLPSPPPPPRPPPAAPTLLLSHCTGLALKAASARSTLFSPKRTSPMAHAITHSCRNATDRVTRRVTVASATWCVWVGGEEGGGQGGRGR